MLLKNRYEYHPQTDFIADGRAAKVYKAFDNETNQNVIIKFYHSLSLLPSAFAANMNNIKLLQHENLVQLFDYFEFEHINYFGQIDQIRIGVWEYVENAKTINLATIDAELAARNVLAGLQYLHQNDCQHLDLNPQNVLVTSNGAVKLNNYGISNQIKNGKSIGSMLPNSASYYYAPEYFDAENADIKTNADLWSFGLLFSEIVNGKKSFDAAATDSIETIYNNVLNIKPEVKVDTKEVYGVMIEQCLQHDSQNRVQSVEDLLNTLDSYDRNKRFNSVLPLSMEQFSSRYAFDVEDTLSESSDSVLIYEAFDNLYDEKVILSLYKSEATPASFETIFESNKKAHVFKLLESESLFLATVATIHSDKTEKSTAVMDALEIENLIEEDLLLSNNGVVSEKATATVSLNKDWQAAIGKIEETVEIADEVAETVAEETVEIADELAETVAEETVEIADELAETFAEETVEIADEVAEDLKVVEDTDDYDTDIQAILAENEGEEESVFSTEVIREEALRELQLDMSHSEDDLSIIDDIDDEDIQAILSENEGEEEAVLSTEVIQMEALKELEAEMKVGAENEEPIVFMQDDMPVSSSPTEVFKREAMEQVLKDMDKLLSND